MTRRRHTLIFVGVALVTILALFTAYAPVGAWGRFADTKSDYGFGEAPLEGETFRMQVKTCLGINAETWEFRPGGELVGGSVRAGSTWSQFGELSWRATVYHTCARYMGYYLEGMTFGPVIVGKGYEPCTGCAFLMLVVGIRE